MTSPSKGGESLMKTIQVDGRWLSVADAEREIRKLRNDSIWKRTRAKAKFDRAQYLEDRATEAENKYLAIEDLIREAA